MKKGLFISFEGPDGSGKSTQIEYLKQYFKTNGIDAVFTREPGGTAIGEKLRQIILDKENSEIGDMTEALLYAASRAQHVDELIRPSLEEGKIVVCDRFIDSSIAYQGYGRNLGDGVRVINELAVKGCMPDLTFFLDLDPEIGKSRIRSDVQDRLESEALIFHQRVYNGYKEMATYYSERFVTIDATETKKEMSDKIISKIRETLKDRGI